MLAFGDQGPRRGYTLGVLDAFKFRLNTLAIVLIPVCIAIDWAGHALATHLERLAILDVNYRGRFVPPE